MKNILFSILLTMISCMMIHAQEIYVDSSLGDDKNPGTREAPVCSIQKAVEIINSRDNDFYIVKINPGIYILDKHIKVDTEKNMTGKRIVIEASILPDDDLWTPEKMPVIANRANKGEIPENSHFVTSFRIDESHVTIRGLKFHGYFYPHTRYNPIGRFSTTETDLLVEQCMFIGDPNVSQLHVGIFANGNEVRIDHCVFYKVRNTVVFGSFSGNTTKFGNGITNSIICGASQALWTALPDKDFKFENNIVSNCRYFWVKNADINKTTYNVDNSIIVNNKYYTGIPDSVRLNPGAFELRENNVTKNCEIILRLTDMDENPALTGIDQPLPRDYMHPIPGSPGSDMTAGLFKKKNQ